ncbi:MAG: CBS domain-containing protein [Gammaproteobacteria bacterium]|nr:CBS domain-containing protein [Gammaproteobacteria bacterium]
MKVHELMTPKLKTISPDASTKEAARMMHDMHIGALPVINDGQLLGIITDRDICCKVTATGRDAGWTKVHEVMTKDLTTCFDDQDISSAAEIMISHHIRRLAVLDRDSVLTGFLSVDDLARTSHELASIVLEGAAPVH